KDYKLGEIFIFAVSLARAPAALEVAQQLGAEFLLSLLLLLDPLFFLLPVEVRGQLAAALEHVPHRFDRVLAGRDGVRPDGHLLRRQGLLVEARAELGVAASRGLRVEVLRVEFEAELNRVFEAARCGREVARLLDLVVALLGGRDRAARALDEQREAEDRHSRFVLLDVLARGAERRACRFREPDVALGGHIENRISAKSLDRLVRIGALATKNRARRDMDIDAEIVVLLIVDDVYQRQVE